MRRLTVFVLFVLVGLWGSGPLWAYQVQATAPQGTNKCARWAQLPIKIEIHMSGSDDVSDGSDIQAVKNALKTWEAPGCNNLTFQVSMTSTTSFSGRNKPPPKDYERDRDGKNVIRWEEKKWEWSETEIARNAIKFDSLTGQMIETDLLMNGVHFKWSTNGASTTIDIETTVLRRVGLIIGLWYSDVPGAMLHPSFDYLATTRNLHQDDINGSCFLYPTSGWKDPPPPPPGTTAPEQTLPEPTPQEPPPSVEKTTDTSGTGPTDGGPTTPTPPGGCKCSSSLASPSLALWALFFLLLPLLRRTRRSLPPQNHPQS